VSLLACLVAWVFLLWQGIRLVRPESTLLPLYDSDSAIPLLMTHDSCTTPFCLFYFGQDRFGAWPFLLGHLLGRIFHFAWSPELLSAWLVAFTFSAAWPLRALALKRDWIVPAYQGAFLLEGALRVDVLNVVNPYGWQASTLIWTWWFLRRVTLSAYPGRWLAAAFLGGALATWMSSTSVVYLALLAFVEFGYARLRPVSERVRGAYLFTLLFPSMVGLAFEASLRSWHHRYSDAKFQMAFVTPLRLDRGHLVENFAALWKQLLGSPWWPLQIAAVLSAVVVLMDWMARLRHRATPASDQHQDDWRALAIASGFICLATFLIAGLVSHVRQNYYHPRYVSLAHFFALLGTAAAVAAIARHRWQLNAHPISSLGSMLAVTSCVATVFPSAGTNPSYGDLKAAASWLADQHAPVVLGSYWGTYVFSGLAVPRGVVPIPVEGDLRTPWTPEAIHQVPQLYVSRYRSARFGRADQPDRWITERGEFLSRGQAVAFARGAITFWLYRNETKRSLHVYPSMPPNRWDGCGLQSLSLTFQPTERAELVYWFEESGGPAVEAWGQTQAGLSIRLERPERGARMVRHRFDVDKPIQIITLRPTPSGENCALRSVALFETASD